jgi:hypothetical protein
MNSARHFRRTHPEDPGWRRLVYAALPQHFLNFLPEPQGHGSLRPALVGVRAGLVDDPDGSGIETCFGPCAAMEISILTSTSSTLASSGVQSGRRDLSDA